MNNILLHGVQSQPSHAKRLNARAQNGLRSARLRKKRRSAGQRRRIGRLSVLWMIPPQGDLLMRVILSKGLIPPEAPAPLMRRLPRHG